MILFHGGTEIVDKPRIIRSYTGRDFGVGFYTTDIREQAQKWARRQARFRKTPHAILNTYDFDESALDSLRVLDFKDYSMKWLDFVIDCRSNIAFVHNYDLVIGKIANDNVGETIQAVLDGLTSRQFALNKLVFMFANNQICFSSARSLQHLKFLCSDKVN